jgi:hypothetical protein
LWLGTLNVGAEKLRLQLYLDVATGECSLNTIDRAQWAFVLGREEPGRRAELFVAVDPLQLPWHAPDQWKIAEQDVVTGHRSAADIDADPGRCRASDGYGTPSSDTEWSENCAGP